MLNLGNKNKLKEHNCVNLLFKKATPSNSKSSLFDVKCHNKGSTNSSQSKLNIQGGQRNITGVKEKSIFFKSKRNSVFISRNKDRKLIFSKEDGSKGK